MPQSDLALVGVLTSIAGFLAHSLYDNITRRFSKREDAADAEADAIRREQYVSNAAKSEAQAREIQLIEGRLAGLEHESKRDSERFHELRGILQPLTNLTYALDKRLAVLETTVTGWQATLDRIENGLAEFRKSIEGCRFNNPHP